VPFVQIAIFGPDGAMLPPGAVGEVGIRTRAAFRGYWNDPAATEAAFHGAHVRTGDLGYLDKDGYLFIVDRARDIIIRGGENIACQEVEAALYAHPDVAEACVYALPDERLGEVPAATVHGADGAILSEAALQAVAAERLASFKRPVRILLSAGRLPRLGSGKIDRKAVRARSLIA
jgi:acyl-CoA synthetase (AMP-forming)/AMP-acid ligase II